MIAIYCVVLKCYFFVGTYHKTQHRFSGCHDDHLRDREGKITNLYTQSIQHTGWAFVQDALSLNPTTVHAPSDSAHRFAAFGLAPTPSFTHLALPPMRHDV